jgi:hypothetical protein
VYISYDVVFDETNFPFASLHANVGTSLKAKILLLPPALRNIQGSDNVDVSNMLNLADIIAESHAETSAGMDARVEDSDVHFSSIQKTTDRAAATNPGMEFEGDSVPPTIEVCQSPLGSAPRGDYPPLIPWRR